MSGGLGLGFRWNKEKTSLIIDDIMYHLNYNIPMERKVISSITRFMMYYNSKLAKICLQELEQANMHASVKDWTNWYLYLHRCEYGKTNLLQLDSIMRSKNYFNKNYKKKQLKLMQERVWNK